MRARTQTYDPTVYAVVLSFVEDTFPRRSRSEQAQIAARIAPQVQGVIEDELQDAADELDAYDAEQRSLKGYTDAEKARI